MATTLQGKIRDDWSISTQPDETAIQEFLVLSDSPTDLGSDAGNTPGIPARGDQYGNNPRLTAQRIFARLKEERDWKQWIVTVEYSTISGSLLPGGNVDDPLQRPIRIFSSSFQAYEEAARFGRLADRPGTTGPIQEGETITLGNTDQPIVNSAGDRFLDPPTDTKYVLGVTIRMNSLVFNPAFYKNYVGRVNATAWQGAEPYTVQLVNVTAEGPIFESGFPEYYTIVFEFAHKPDTFLVSIQDAGIYELVEVVPTAGQPYLAKQRMKDKDGVEIVEPDFLNGEGKQLTIDPNAITAGFDVFYRCYLTKKVAEFDDLGIF